MFAMPHSSPRRGSLGVISAASGAAAGASAGSLRRIIDADHIIGFRVEHERLVAERLERRRRVHHRQLFQARHQLILLVHLAVRQRARLAPFLGRRAGVIPHQDRIGDGLARDGQGWHGELDLGGRGRHSDTGGEKNGEDNHRRNELHSFHAFPPEEWEMGQMHTAQTNTNYICFIFRCQVGISHFVSK